MKNVDVFYFAVSAEGEEVLKVIILPDMPDTLANELINGSVRPQMRIFLDNLALLQGYEFAIFQLANEHVPEGVDIGGKARL